MGDFRAFPGLAAKAARVPPVELEQEMPEEDGGGRKEEETLSPPSPPQGAEPQEPEPEREPVPSGFRAFPGLGGPSPEREREPSLPGFRAFPGLGGPTKKGDEEERDGDIISLDHYFPETGRTSKMEVDLSKHTPDVAAVLRKYPERSPLAREGGVPVPEEKVLTPLLSFSEPTKHWSGMFSETRTGLNYSAVVTELEDLYVRRAVADLKTAPTSDEFKQIREKARQDAKTEIQKDIEKGILPYIDIDPEETSRKISEGELGPLADVLTLGAAHWMPHEMYENLVAPVVAGLTPATTATIREGKQAPRQAQQSLVWYYANFAPTTFLGSYWLSEDPDLEWGSPEHLQKIRTGYSVFHDLDKIGDAFAENSLIYKAAEPYVDKDTLDNAAWWAGLATTIGVVLIEPDLIGGALNVVGKGAKFLKVAERMGIGVAGTMARGDRVLGEVLLKMDEDTLTKTPALDADGNPRMGDDGEPVFMGPLEVLHQELKAHPDIRQSVDLYMGMRFGGERVPGLNETGSWHSSRTDALYRKIPALAEELEETQEALRKVQAEGGADVDAAQINALIAEHELRATELRATVGNRKKAEADYSFGVELAEMEIGRGFKAPDLRGVTAEQVATLTKEMQEYQRIIDLYKLARRGKADKTTLEELAVLVGRKMEEVTPEGLENIRRGAIGEELANTIGRGAVTGHALTKNLANLAVKGEQIALLKAAEKQAENALAAVARSLQGAGATIDTTGKAPRIVGKAADYARAVAKVEEAQAAKEAAESIPKTIIQHLKDLRSSYRVGLELARKSPGLNRFKDDVWAGVIRDIIPEDALTKGARIDPTELRAKLVEMYTEDVVAAIPKDSDLGKFLRGVVPETPSAPPAPPTPGAPRTPPRPTTPTPTPTPTPTGGVIGAERAMPKGVDERVGGASRVEVDEVVAEAERLGITGADEPLSEGAEAAIRGMKTSSEVAAYLAENSTIPAFRAIASRIAPYVEDIEFRIIDEGSMEAIGSFEEMVSRGSQASFNPIHGIRIAGKGWTGPFNRPISGLDEESVLHELLHGATTWRLLQAEASDDAVLRGAYDTLEGIVETLRCRRELAQKPGDGQDWLARAEDVELERILDSGDAVDELISYAFTNPEIHRLLRDTPFRRDVGDKNLWTAFVDTIRRLFGISKEEGSVLDRVIRATDTMWKRGDELAAEAGEVQGTRYATASQKMSDEEIADIVNKFSLRPVDEDGVRAPLTDPGPGWDGRQVREILDSLGQPEVKRAVMEDWAKVLGELDDTDDMAKESIRQFLFLTRPRYLDELWGDSPWGGKRTPYWRQMFETTLVEAASRLVGRPLNSWVHLEPALVPGGANRLVRDSLKWDEITPVLEKWEASSKYSRVEERQLRKAVEDATDKLSAARRSRIRALTRHPVLGIDWNDASRLVDEEPEIVALKKAEDVAFGRAIAYEKAAIKEYKAWQAENFGGAAFGRYAPFRDLDTRYATAAVPRSVPEQVTAKQIAAFQKTEREMATQARGKLLRRDNLLHAQRLLDDARELSVARQGFSFLDTSTYLPVLRAAINRNLQIWDPTVRRTGVVSKEDEQLHKAAINAILRGRDELKALIDYARKEGIDIEEAVYKYLDDQLSLDLPTGKTTINQGALNLSRRAFHGLANDRRVQAIAKGEALDEDVPSYLKAMALHFVPDQTIRNTSAKYLADQRKLLRRVAEMIVNPATRKDPALPWTWRTFSDEIKAATEDVFAPGIPLVQKDPKRAVMGLQAVMAAAVHYDTLQMAARTFGGVDRSTADRLTAMMKGKWGSKGRDTVEIENVYEQLVAHGMPSFAHRRIKKLFGEVRELDARLYEVAGAEGFGKKGESIFLPMPLLKGLEGRIDKIIKDIAQYHQAPAKSPMGKMVDSFMAYANIWRQDKVTGIGLPNISHWITTAFSDFAQIGFTHGFGLAARLSFQNAFSNFGTWGRRYADLASDMSNRLGKEGNVLATPLNAMMNPHVAAVWRGENRIVKTATGELINLKDLQKWAMEDGVLDTFYRHDQQKIMNLVSKRLEDMNIFERGKHEWAKAREWTGAAMSAVQQRQRMGLYMEFLINRGAGRAGAKKAVDDALYDWTHGITEWELVSLAKISAFYRYWRLAMGQVARHHIEAFTKPGDMKEILTGQTHIRRMQKLATFSKEVPRSLAEMDNPDDLFDDLEQEELYARSRAPWHLMEGTRPWLYNGPLSEPWQEWEQYEGRGFTHSVTQLPVLGPTDALEMWLTLGMGIMGSMKAIAGGDVPEEFYTNTAQPFVDMLMPTFQGGVGAALDTAGLTNLHSAPDKSTLRTGEKVLFDTLESMPITGPMAEALGSRLIEKDKRGRETIPAFWATMFRSLPIVSSHGVRYADAIFGTPDDVGFNEDLAHFLGTLTGIKKVPYAPLDVDPGFETTQRMKAIEETIKSAGGELRANR